jgi:hypothetical protein
MTALGDATRKTLLPAALALFGMMAVASGAFAVSLRVQLACASDYYAHCSAHSPDGPGVRSCMRAVGAALSKRCVEALVHAGEVSSTEVARYRAKVGTAAK